MSLVLYDRLSTCVTRLHDYLFVYPLQRVYLKAYWLGLPPENICATLTGVTASFWLEHEKECYERIGNNFEGWQALLDYFLINAVLVGAGLLATLVFLKFLFCRSR
jgi:hypothetical protein